MNFAPNLDRVIPWWTLLLIVPILAYFILPEWAAILTAFLCGWLLGVAPE